MNIKVAHICASLLTGLLLLIPVFFHGFKCHGYAFSAECGSIRYLQIMGGLVLCAGALICLAALIITLTFLCHAKWLYHATISVTTLSTILSAAAVILYYNSTKAWSPFMASMAMTISLIHTATLLIEVATRLFKSS